MIKFSVVIPTYNEEKYIKKCLEACYNLNYPKNIYEIIVIDNNSTDNTVKIVSQHRLVKLFSERKQGISFARQKGLNVSKGQYYVSIDADTVLPKNYLKQAEILINKHKNFACIFGPVKIYDSNNKTLKNSVHLATKVLGLTEKHIYNCNAIYNKNYLLKVGGFSSVYPNFDDGIITVIFKKRKYKILFTSSLVAYISGRRYSGLKAFSIFKNLCVYYKYKIFNI